MGETSTTATLVGTRDMFAPQSAAVTATVSRDEIEAALNMDPPADLILEVLRRPEAAEGVQKHVVHVAWKRADLESLLRIPDSDEITFSFDPAELERAIDEPDVEGHGLREAAVVLSIAAAAAVAGVSNAAAEPGGAVYSPQAAISAHDEATLAARGIESGTVAAVHDEATLAARGVESGTLAATSAHDEATLTARGVEAGTVPAAHDEATLAARGVESGTPTAASVHDEATLAARGVEAGTVPASHDEATLAARGVESGTFTAASAHDEATLAARGVEPGTVAAVHDEATLAARGVEPASPQTVSDTGFEFPSVDSGTFAGIAGGLAGAGLLIAAAAFATTRRREPEQFA
jgi:hypothetical protein